ncbi:hypothetical protein [Caminibacter sp.]
MKKVGFLFITILMLLMNGCANLNMSDLFKPPTPEEIIKNSKDPYLTKGFLDYFKNKKLNNVSIVYRSNYIKIQDYISGQQGHVNMNITSAINEYLNRYSNNDYISKLYIKLANERGNTVKMYKTFVTQKIAKLLPIYGTDYQGVYAKLNLDNCYIEYDKNGLMKSILIRTHFFPKNFGTMHYRDNWIIFGRLINIVQNNLPNSVLEEGYITTFKIQK